MQATVKFTASEPKDFGRGPRLNVVVTLPDGSEGRIYSGPGQGLEQLQKGQVIQVAPSGANYKLTRATGRAVAIAEPLYQAPPAAAPESGERRVWNKPPLEVRKQMAEFIEYRAQLAKFAFDQVAAEFEQHNLKSEDLRAIATSICISLERRFE